MKIRFLEDGDLIKIQSQASMSAVISHSAFSRPFPATS
jgi:hypothetical protein